MQYRSQKPAPSHSRARSRRPQQLSKSRFVAGLKCPKLLWWLTHEGDAPELEPGSGLQAVIERGHQVGELARTYVPGGLLIDLPYWQVEERVAATARAIAARTPVIYEASFLEDGIFVAIDILARVRGGYVLSEVKATLSVKDEHIPDLAVQLHVATAAGLTIRRAELMHLNRACVYPDLSNLFVREDVTEQVERSKRSVPRSAAAMTRMLAGGLPDIEPGEQCDTPHPCPFQSRCLPELPEHHVSTLYRIQPKKRAALEARGITTLDQLPAAELPPGPARRQVASVQARRLIAQGGLQQALQAFALPVAFLDFETITPPVPVWGGCTPYQPVAVQMSCHVLAASGVTHHEWLANGDSDPREALARAVLDACAGARTILAYHAPFERGQLLALAEALPALRAKLQSLAGRLGDLLVTVRDHVYHPAFGGSFSLKAVLPALVPELSYEGLAIADGREASLQLEGLLLHRDQHDAEAREQLRAALLDYCRLDTYGMVRLFERLRALGA